MKRCLAPGWLVFWLHIGLLDDRAPLRDGGTSESRDFTKMWTCTLGLSDTNLHSETFRLFRIIKNQRKCSRSALGVARWWRLPAWSALAALCSGWNSSGKIFELAFRNFLISPSCTSKLSAPPAPEQCYVRKHWIHPECDKTWRV